MHARDAESSVAFLTSHFLPRRLEQRSAEASRARACRVAASALFQWASQVQAIGTAMQRNHAMRVSIHLFSLCMSPALAEAMSTCRHGWHGCHAPLRLHAHHAVQLRHAVGAMQQYAREHECCEEWASDGVNMLLRWEVFAMEHTKVVVYLDLDVEVLPRWSLLLLHSHPSRHTDRQVVAVASEWAHLTACASSSASLLFSYPDHSSPVHGAVLIARPNASLYADGLHVLRRATKFAPFNASLGMLGGRVPSSHLQITCGGVAATTRISWMRTTGGSSEGAVRLPPRSLPLPADCLTVRLLWSLILCSHMFVVSSHPADQGFLYYMLRVRHQLGADIRLSECARASPAGSQPSYYFHYGSVGGEKPYSVLERWLSLKQKHRCYGRVVPHFGENGEVIGRTLSWLRRTRAEMADLIRSFESRQDETSLSAKAELSLLLSTLDDGMSCLVDAARLGRRSYNVTLPIWLDGPGSQLRQVPLRHSGGGDHMRRDRDTASSALIKTNRCIPYDD
ncbi:MAG: hypothetical protein SGPRY_007398 [Prymnesium sp.]